MSFPNFLETFQHFRFIYGFCYFWNCAKKMFGPKRLRPILFCVVNIQKNFGFYFAICLETFFWYTRTVLKYLLVCDFRLLYLEASVFHCVGGLFVSAMVIHFKKFIVCFPFFFKKDFPSWDIRRYHVISKALSGHHAGDTMWWFRFFVPKGWSIFS